jgi:hypothetical protein
MLLRWVCNLIECHRSIHYFEPGTAIKVQFQQPKRKPPTFHTWCRCMTLACHVTSSCACVACATSRFYSRTRRTGRPLPGALRMRMLIFSRAVKTLARVLANYAWKMLVFSDAAERWRHIMWLDAGQELRASIDGVRAILHSTGPSQSPNTQR